MSTQAAVLEPLTVPSVDSSACYELHMQHGKEVLREDSPRRILTSQKRGAANQRLVLEQGPKGRWDYIGTAAEIREIRREEDQGEPELRFKGWKLDTWEA